MNTGTRIHTHQHKCEKFLNGKFGFFGFYGLLYINWTWRPFTNPRCCLSKVVDYMLYKSSNPTIVHTSGSLYIHWQFACKLRSTKDSFNGETVYALTYPLLCGYIPNLLVFNTKYIYIYIYIEFIVIIALHFIKIYRPGFDIMFH